MFLLRSMVLCLPVLGVVLLGLSQRAYACAGPPPDPPPLWVMPGAINDAGDQEFWIILHNYTTFAANPGQNCACGLSLVPSPSAVIEIHGVDIIDSATQVVLTGFPFVPNATTTEGLESVSETGGWQGFLATVTDAIPGNTTVDLHFRIWVKTAGVVPGSFKRGDANSDGCVSDADGSFINDYLFGGGPAPLCPDAADANDDGRLDRTDQVYILNYSAGRGPPPPAPGPIECGPDPTPDDSLPTCDYPPAACTLECPPGAAGQGGSHYLDEVMNAVANSLTATDEGNPDGSLTGNHQDLRSPGEIQVMLPPEPPFRRGDTNHDETLDISDGISTLQWLFLSGGSRPECLDAADADDDGELLITDAIFTFSYLFLPGGAPPPAPGPTLCGLDPSADLLDCHEGCP